jgi:hypothetical protein
VAQSALQRQSGVKCTLSRTHWRFVSGTLWCQLKCYAIRAVCRQQWCGVHAKLDMNKSAILPDALNRFRHAASQYAPTAKSSASRLLALKDDIAALRKRGVSYHAISELLTQSGISASATCVMNFCHRILMERRRKPSATRRALPVANPNTTRKTKPSATSKTALSATPVANVGASPAPTESAPVKIRGPHIAKVELLPPGEQYD